VKLTIQLIVRYKFNLIYCSYTVSNEFRAWNQSTQSTDSGVRTWQHMVIYFIFKQIWNKSSIHKTSAKKNVIPQDCKYTVKTE